MDLMQASNQWAQRPDDERYWTLQEMHQDALRQLERSAEHKLTDGRSLRVGYDEHVDDMALHSDIGSFRLNNWTFKQLCGRVQAPASYLQSLRPELASQCLNQGLSRLEEGSNSGIELYSDNGTLRSLLSGRYARIHDAHILSRLLPLQAEGWRTPPARPTDSYSGKTRPATAADVSSRSLVKEGDIIAPAGLYRGDRDMFAFMINDQVRIDDGTDGGLARGFFVHNSEVGASSFSYTEFAFRYICGNHIVWGAQDVREVRLRHIGAAKPAEAMRALTCELIDYANQSTAQDELIIKRAKAFELGRNPGEVVDFLFGKRLMTRTLAQQAQTVCEQTEPQLNPRSVWGITQGITRLSQRNNNADERHAMDALTPKLLTLVN
jgi:hypothetical protein